jgi:pimeloyl-ACP methyl ester carboxylesterase
MTTQADDSIKIGRRALAMGVLASTAVMAGSRAVRAQSREQRPIVVMVPGTFSDAVQFEHQVKHLADVADVRVSMRHAMHETMAGMADGILRDAPERFSIIGLSLGGRAAFEVARRAPDRVARLGVMASTAQGGTSPARQRVADLQREKGYAQMVDVMIPMLVPPPRLKDEAWVQHLRAMLLRAGPEVADRQAKASDSARDHWDYLPQIKVPTLLICGRQDRIAVCTEVARTAQAIANATLVEIDDCGHLPSMEHPEVVTAAMRKWLAA